jgi:hypothetical protein
MLDPSDLQHALEIVPVDRQTSRARSGSNHELIVLKLLTVLEDDLVLVELELSDGGVCSEIDVERSGGVLGGGSDCELLGVDIKVWRTRGKDEEEREESQMLMDSRSERSGRYT